MAEPPVEDFLTRFGTYVAWFLVGLLIGFLPYLVAIRRRPDLRRQARGIYAGAAVGFGLLVGGAFPLLPSEEGDVGQLVDGGRYESSAHGFALTFPEGWKAVKAATPMTDGEDQIHLAAITTGRMLWGITGSMSTPTPSAPRWAPRSSSPKHRMPRGHLAPSSGARPARGGPLYVSGCSRQRASS